MITALHGFLGEGADWDFLRTAGFVVESPDLFRYGPLAESMPAWSEQFLATASPPAGRNTLLGYSLGGRLALHALLADRGRRFDSAVIVSAGLGVEDAARREYRQESDECWARRFEHDQWNALITDWNAQPVFGGAESGSERIESSFDRQALAEALRRWSPARQEPLLGHLAEIDVDVLWVAGEHDAQYVEEGRRALTRLGRARLWVCPDAGHRVPWEQPLRFTETLRTFLDERD